VDHPILSWGKSLSALSSLDFGVESRAIVPIAQENNWDNCSTQIAGASIENKGDTSPSRKGDTDERGMVRLDNLLTSSRGKNVMNPGILIGANLKIFRLGQLPPGMPVQITVTAKGYIKKALSRVEATLESESEVLDVELTPEDDSMFRTVSGMLIDSSGKPIAGANVRLLVFKEAGRSLGSCN